MQKSTIVEVEVATRLNGTVKSTLDENRHSEDIHEIITKVPSWILRWGITLFFGILLMILAISVLVRYPDTVKTGLKIESQDAPVILTAPIPAKVLKVLAKKGEVIKRGQPLIQIERADSSAGIVSVLTAPRSGTVAFITLVQPGDVLTAGQPILHIYPQNEQFYGVIQISQNSITKVKEGQEVLINLTTYPAEDYGQLKGKITQLADEPLNGFFTAKVTFTNSNALKKTIRFKTWMTGQAEIITENVSLQKRIYNSITKGLQ